MKERLLQYLACPSCQDALRIQDVGKKDGIEILDGNLQCSKCGASFPIVRGVPRFANLAEIEEDKAATASSFGWEWQHFTQEDDRYGEQMLGWLDPVTEDFFRDKVVLDGGCGKGRHTRLAASWGARDVIGVDLSDAVESAFAATRGSENMHIVQADLCRLPLGQVIDYAFTIGVIHHLPDPNVGFKSIASRIKPGGHFSVWVYGAENNAWITRVISPLRKRFTSRMNRKALLHLSKLPTAAVYAATKLVFGPLNKFETGTKLARKLFYGEYLSSLSSFGWREQHTIVFDHLVPPTAQYVTREEFEKWWDGIGAKETVIGWHNKNSWRGFGRTNGNREE
jgi:SAM-dependent methyltransferase